MRNCEYSKVEKIHGKKPENKEMSNEEINIMLDKMLKILGSFGSNDPQFLKEYNEVVKGINGEEQKKEIYSNKLRDFRSKNKLKYFEHIQIRSVNGAKYDHGDDFKWKVMQDFPKSLASKLTCLKDDKSKIKSSFANNSVKFKILEDDWQLELINDKSLRIQEWECNRMLLCMIGGALLIPGVANICSGLAANNAKKNINELNDELKKVRERLDKLENKSVG